LFAALYAMTATATSGCVGFKDGMELNLKGQRCHCISISHCFNKGQKEKEDEKRQWMTLLWDIIIIRTRH